MNRTLLTATTLMLSTCLLAGACVNLPSPPPAHAEIYAVSHEADAKRIIERGVSKSHTLSVETLDEKDRHGNTLLLVRTSKSGHDRVRELLERFDTLRAADD